MEIYSAVVECSRELAENTLDLIDRQKAEIEELKDILEKVPTNAYDLQVEASEKLENQIKSEAIKEFAERLIEKCYEGFRETDEMLSPFVKDEDI